LRKRRQAPRRKPKPPSKNCDIHSYFLLKGDKEDLSPTPPSPPTPPFTPMKPNYRCCASCRKIAPKEAFWRVVRLYPSHQVQLDRGMGRSAYLCREAECLKAAQKKNRLGRSLKAPVSDELYQTLWQRLATSECKSDRTSDSGPAKNRQ
jgi:predicted RNA-binding protein YlxR (DUF448 family)